MRFASRERDETRERRGETSAVDWFFFFSLSAPHVCVERDRGRDFSKKSFRERAFLLYSAMQIIEKSIADGGDAFLSASHSLILSYASRKRALLARGVVSPFPQKVSSKKKKERNGRPRKKNASTKKRRARLCAKRNDYYYSVPCVREACLRNSFFSILRVEN